MAGKAVSGIFLTLLLASVLTLAFGIQPVRSSPNTIIVPDDYSSIQAAVTAVNSGGTIYVRAGTYNEPQITIRKPLQLIGENQNTTIVEGGGAWICFYVQSTNDVTITGFTVQNGWGVYSWGSSNVNISGNIIRNNGQGLVIGQSRNVVVSKNIVAQNGALSIFLTFSNNNIVSGNIVTQNNGDAVWLDHSYGNLIRENNISKNALETQPRYHARGVRLDWSGGNAIYANNIVDNYEQALSWYSFNNTWDNGFEGNYWSDYTGIDNSTPPDGIGDTPYVIDSNNQDNYPLMNRYWNPTDINHDLKVDIKDIDTAALAYGSFLGYERWNPRADITGPKLLVPDSKVDIIDIALIAKHYGETYP